jgi:hypothetical protein
MEENRRKLPLRKAIYWIIISTFLVSGSTGAALLYFWNLKRANQQDPKYTIVAIVQRGPDKDILKTEYLAELLGLSLDKPTNLFKLSAEKAKRRLLQSPLIRSVEVKKVKPGTLYIDYRVRKPIAYFADFSNTALDEEGVMIPFAPFFTPKKLPEIVSGTLENCRWGDVLHGEHVAWALDLLKNNPNIKIKRIDLSHVAASSFGQREIVLILETPSTRILRLPCENISPQLANYKVLEKHLADNPNSLIIDLRIPHLAFLKEL